MTLNAWLLFTATEAVLCLTPGPAVLFVLSYGLARGGRASLWANAGILAGNAFYFALSALGLGAALLASNPKALIYFVALLPQFINTNHAIWPQVLLLGVTSVVIEFFVLAGYGCLASRVSKLARRPRFVTATNRASGGMMVAAGTGIALTAEQ